MVVVGLDLLPHPLHLGIMGFLMLNGGVDPFVVRLRCEATDHHHILAPLVHQPGQSIHEVNPVSGVVECLDVVVHILLCRCLVSDDDDLLVPGLLENRL